MTNFKDEINKSLNLPSTKFSMKANLTGREPVWQKTHTKLYSQMNHTNNVEYILHDGPPYANGNIHIGHAINKVLKDIIAKSQRLQHMSVPFIPGWDCHGLPIELAVEKEVGKPSDTLSKKDFRKACRKYAYKHIKAQKAGFSKLSILADWDNPYLTMNYKTEGNTLRALGKIINNGYLAHSLKPIHWCMDCESVLAEAEVEHKEIKSNSMDVLFRLKDTNTFIVIHTTTPWTLFSNEAVAYNKNVQYSGVLAYDSNDVEYSFIVASALLEDCLKKYKWTKTFIQDLNDEDVTSRMLINPITNKEVPVVHSNHVTDKMGTGFVHIAPAYGVDDMKVGKDNNLPITDIVSKNGYYTSGVMEGEHISSAADFIYKEFKKYIPYCNDVLHKYPHCWRHKTPTIFKSTPQWFIKMNVLAPAAIKELDNVRFFPESGKNRLISMLTNRPDWCISRQRTWGVPIALYYHPITKELHPNTSEILSKVASEMDTQGVDVWDDYPQELDGYIKCTDVLDVWFDSGVTHDTVIGKQADTYLEGSDQHRGWFQTSLLTSMAINNKAPFKNVVTHGFAVDKFGKKMSKSEGNVISPEELTEKHGVDIVRLWIASINYHNEIVVDDKILENISQEYRKIRNTIKYLLSNSSDINTCVQYDDLLEFDKYIIGVAGEVQAEIINAYNDFNFTTVVDKIHKFCSDTLGSLYLDVTKDRQYTMQRYSLGRMSAQTTCTYVLKALLTWIAPIMPFTADEASKMLDASNDVFTTDFQPLPVYTNTTIDWKYFIALRNLINTNVEQSRQRGEIGSSLQADITFNFDMAGEGKHKFASIKKHFHELKYLFICNSFYLGVDSKYPNIEVRPSENIKCERCWHYHPTVINHAEHICERCVTNMFGSGEERLFA